MRRSTEKALKTVLSVFLIYHLCTVILMPIGGSLFGRKLSHYFVPYANQFGFNTTWQFFSPGPSPMFYLEYEPEYDANPESASPENLPEKLTYPPSRAPFSWDDGWNRRLYGMRFFALNPERMERYFVAFLCRSTPKAIAISVQAVFEKIEDIERAGETATFKEMSERIDLPRQRYPCPQLGENP